MGGVYCRSTIQIFLLSYQSRRSGLNWLSNIFLWLMKLCGTDCIVGTYSIQFRTIDCKKTRTKHNVGVCKHFSVFYQAHNHNFVPCIVELITISYVICLFRQLLKHINILYKSRCSKCLQSGMVFLCDFIRRMTSLFLQIRCNNYMYFIIH